MPFKPEKYQTTTVVWRKDFADDLWSIRIRPEEPLVFQPGQYATLAIELGSEVVERPYSIVSSPREQEIEFFFELVPHGGLTPRLHEVKVGEKILMRRQAKGRFTLDEKSGHKQHLMVATVTGVAPYVGMVRTLAFDAKRGGNTGLRVVVLESASRSWEFGYDQELRQLAEEHPWLTYIPTISRPWEDSAWKGEVGRAEDILRKYMDSLGLAPETTTAYLCGQPQMVENARGILQRRGFTKEFVREEVYWVPQ